MSSKNDDISNLSESEYNVNTRLALTNLKILAKIRCSARTDNSL